NGQVYVAGLRLLAGRTDHQRTACASLTARRLRARTYVCLNAQAAESVADAPPAGGQVLLELRDLVAAAADECQLAGDVGGRLLEDLPLPHRILHPAAPFSPQGRARLLGRHQLRE